MSASPNPHGMISAFIIALLLFALPVTPLASAQVPRRLELTLRISSIDGPASFSDIRGLVANAAGEIFVLDYSSQELRAFDRSGKFMRTVARRGRGPGELLDANGLAISPNGVVWVNDPGNRRYTRIWPDGHVDHLAQRERTFGATWGGVVDSSGGIFEPGVLAASLGGRAAQAPSQFLLRYLDSAGGARTVPTPSCVQGERQPSRLRFIAPDGTIRNVNLPFFAAQQIALSSVGHMWCTPSDDYRLFFGPPTALREIVHEKIGRIPVSAAEHQRERRRLDSLAKQYGTLVAGDPGAIPRVKPAIDYVLLDDRERLWVRRTSSDSLAHFDVWTTTGERVLTVRSNTLVGRVMYIRGEDVYAVVTDEDGVPAVARYRVRRRAPDSIPN